MKKGVILLPTLNRVDLLKRFLKSIKETKAECAGYILVDAKDLEANGPGYAEVSIELPKNWNMIDTRGAVSMGDKVRYALETLDLDCDWVGLLNDDHVCVTPEWDKTIGEMIDGTNMVSTNDGYWNFGVRVAGLTAWSMPLLEACGFPIFPRNLQHLFIDDVWKAIGDQTGCWLETMKVNIEHRHAFKHEMEQDQTFKKVYEKASWEYDAKEFQFFMENDFKGVVQKILELRTKALNGAKFV